MRHSILTAAIAATCAFGAMAQSNGLVVYINPGHGGHESNDRNVVIAPYTQGDPNGYWESNSNLEKGLALRDMLESLGYKVYMSRVTNTEDDDLNLSTISSLANKSNADIFFSIHSNATGVAARRNFPLMLYRGWDGDPVIPENLTIAQILNKQLLENKATYWTSTSINCRGDWSFYTNWGYQVGLGVLRGLTVKGILSEGSFHDYIPEAYRLMNKEFCKLEAFHFRKTVDEFFNQPGDSKGLIIGRINDGRVPRAGDYIIFGDDKMATVQGVKVDLYNASGALVSTYTTDPVLVNGIYGFYDLEPGTYTIKASVATHYDCETTVEVKADEATYANLQMNKVRNTPPVVESYGPVWKDGDEPLLCNTPIEIHFNWDMDTEATEKAFKIEPEVEGTFEWTDLNYCMIFKPAKAYDTNTRYTVTIGKGATHASGMTMAEPFTFSFMTTDRNFMEILGYYPSEGDEVHYQGATIEFRFDKLPNVSQILKQITCVDENGNEVVFNKRKMSNSKANAAYGFFRIPLQHDLEVGKSYRLTLSGDFADKDGITIQAPVEVHFTATDAGSAKADETMLTMDDAAQFIFDNDSAIGVASASAATDTAEKLFDDASTAFTYAFSEQQDGEALWRCEAGEGRAADANNRLGVHVYGDLTSNELSLEFTSEVSTRYVKVCDMDFLGWRYIEVPLTELEAESRITGVKLVQRSSQMSQTGTFRIDNVNCIGESGVEAIEIADLTVGPLPASELLIANCGVTITGMELYNLEGQLAARAAGNVVRVDELPAGIYMLRVITESGAATVKVPVVR